MSNLLKNCPMFLLHI